MRRMKIGLSIPAISVMSLVVWTATASAQVVEMTVPLSFSGPNDVFTFQIEKAQGAGDLIVDTKDNGLEGDHWRVDLITEQPANPQNDATGIGNGSLEVFSGDALSHPFSKGEVDVSYVSGVDVFPARMFVRFRYTKASGIFIDPVPSAAAFGTLGSESGTSDCSGPNC